ncbi:enoyl-CoA hydratase/isomerase family protein [Desulfoscipio geothermicus]|uniref:short-chain-enoyl-CoA hydratase n=1 Tax=Desulfoscipio geothermicus DSM 3669 TaxID=1121426 RepID=A0A1I6DGF7_9FIRM|nr:enoyl-CoA hydratase-related protein [Desulfoscipio geothermicus]SFR04560.1 enoyl-CoA hydratase [Desulfoscipio geothermicus DSM 3669]
MDFKFLIYEKEGYVSRVTLNRPKVLNALNSEVFDEIGRAMDLAAADDGVHAVVITGGEKVFAAGADIAEMATADPVSVYKFGETAQGALNKVENLPKPVIAAINGYALGGGCELALACDIRIAGESAKIGLPEINLGIFPGAGGTQRLPRLVGAARAKELMFTGDMIDAARAEKIGLVNQVVPDGEVLSTAVKLAARMAQKGAVAMAMLKTAINQGLATDLASGLNIERQCFSLLFATEDQKEGMQAFMEKRKPEFKGR